MAKKQPNGYYDPATGTFIPTKKKKRVWPWIVIAVIVIGIIGASSGNKKSASNTETDGKTNIEQSSDKTTTEPDVTTPEQEAATDFSDVPTEYTLSAGQYYAGVDIPCGKFDLLAVSGSGNVSSSNIYKGGINGLYAKPGDGPDYYDEAYNGIKLPEGERINICDNLVVKITYSHIDAGFTGRTEDTANTITLIQGNYDVGTDIPEGIYTIRIKEGSGHIGYNVYGGGLNETMAAPGEAEGRSISYIPEFKNAYFPAGDELTIRGMTVELVPMIPGVTP